MLSNDSSIDQAIVITTINAPTKAVQSISRIADWQLIVVGDTKTPIDWHWPGVTYLSLDDQIATAEQFAAACPEKHYSRKNVGYLYAMGRGATVIAETDDDNLPYDSFPGTSSRYVEGRPVIQNGWINVYRHFSNETIWPRGFPLELLRSSDDGSPKLGEETSYECAIQQYLADGDPDVDAVYRLTVGREVNFSGEPIILEPGTFCPFNSQNTVWWPEAYPLLYLPIHASFRMTDIWRSFVAQICLYAMGGRLAFRPSTVYQERNEHSLLRDFESEVPGYLHNADIVRILSEISLSSEKLDVVANLRLCYQSLVEFGYLPDDELRVLDLWIEALPIPFGNL